MNYSPILCFLKNSSILVLFGYIAMSTITFVFFIIIYTHLGSTLPSPLQSSARPSFLSFLQSAQQCHMAMCRSPFHDGAAYCRDLNPGCVFCGPNLRSIHPFVTFVCIGHWEQPIEGRGSRAANVSRNTSAVIEIVESSHGDIIQ